MRRRILTLSLAAVVAAVARRRRQRRGALAGPGTADDETAALRDRMNRARDHLTGT